jgi:hypothetical protein
MKRLLALFVMLAVLGLCAPSYGYILIYKAQMYGKVLNFDDSAIEYGKVKAFLVLQVDIVEDGPKEVSLASDFDGVGADLIFYDRYKGPKFYAEFSSPTLYIHLTQAPQPDPTTEAISLSICEQVQANLVGNLKPTDIGLGKKVNVPRELAGSMLMNGMYFDFSDIIGAATVTATLETKLTKMANSADVASEEEAFELTIDAIINSLQDKGFKDLFDY